MALFGRSICASRPMAAVAAAFKNQATTANFTAISARCASSVNRQWRTETVDTSHVAFTPAFKSIDVDELQRLRQDDENNLILVDVRERTEIDHNNPFIPGCINIPLGSIQTALTLNRCEFRKKYRKPMDVHKLVFICCIGKRSALAAEYAAKLGIANTRFLQGGFEAYQTQNDDATAM